jgi:hypothetical protein
MKFKRSSSQVRRSLKWLAIAFATITATLVLLSAPSLAATQASTLTVYRDPSCSCCGGWMSHLVSEGFEIEEIATSKMNLVKQQQGVPNRLASCHTATIGGYAIEGHVPAKDIKRLLAQQPQVAGIAVAGMPIGTPGMEDGERREPFTVFWFDRQGNAGAFNRYVFEKLN